MTDSGLVGDQVEELQSTADYFAAYRKLTDAAYHVAVLQAQEVARVHTRVLVLKKLIADREALHASRAWTPGADGKLPKDEVFKTTRDQCIANDTDIATWSQELFELQGLEEGFRYAVTTPEIAFHEAEVRQLAHQLRQFRHAHPELETGE